MAGGIVSLGLPGAIIFALATPFLALVYGVDFWSKLPGDKAWPLVCYKVAAKCL